jgi:cytochrome P450
MLLDAPVPDPGPPGPYGTMAWLRATVSRFANGETHTRRRALVEALLAGLDPAELRQAARDCAHAANPAPQGAGPRLESKVDRALHDEPCSRRADAAYVPVAVLARALGVEPPHLADAVAATRLVASAYHPHTDAPGAAAALATLLELLPSAEPEAVAARVQILVQACEATAGLVRGDDLPVPVTRRIGTHGETVLVDLTGRPFGAGSRRCPGEAHARALVEGVLDR